MTIPSLAEIADSSEASEAEQHQKDLTLPPSEEIDVAMPPAIILAIGILARSGIQIAKRQIAKSFTETAAKSIARNFVNNKIRKLKDFACFVVEGADYQRLVLGPDKSTALFAGSHEAYNNFINSDQFYKACRKRQFSFLM